MKMRIKLWQSIPKERTRERVMTVLLENNSKKDFSNYECFTCHKLGHISINCPMKAERVKNMKIFQAHVAQDSDQEDSEEYVLISTLTVSVSPGNETWLVDSGASKNMVG